MTEIQLLSRRWKIHDTPSAKTPDFSLTYLQGTVDSGKNALFPKNMIIPSHLILVIIFSFFFFYSFSVIFTFVYLHIVGERDSRNSSTLQKSGNKLLSMLASPSCGYKSDFFSLQNISKCRPTDSRLYHSAKWFRSCHLKKINSSMLSIGYVMCVGKINNTKPLSPAVILCLWRHIWVAPCQKSMENL